MPDATIVLVISLWLAACDPMALTTPSTSSSDSDGYAVVATTPSVSTTDIDVPPCAEDPVCVDVSSLPPKWTASPGYEFGVVGLLPDVTGDGHPEVRLWMSGPAGEAWAIVYGPLDRSLVLPGEADVVILVEYLTTFHDLGDHTGDAVPDLLISHPDGYWWFTTLVEGPLPPLVDAETPGLVTWPAQGLEVGFEDTDGDDLYDYVWSDPAGGLVEIWRGDPTAWGIGDPQLSLEFTCGADAPFPYDSPSEREVTIWPCGNDVDGDGVDEIKVDGGTSCDTMLVPANLEGMVVDPTGIPSRCVDDAGDQDSDGNVDFVLEIDDVDTVVAGPLVVTDSGLTGTSLFALFELVTNGFAGPAGADVDGDGVDDFGAFADEGHSLLYFSGGANGGASTGMYMRRFAFEGEASDTWMEDGRPFRAFDVEGGVAVVVME